MESKTKKKDNIETFLKDEQFWQNEVNVLAELSIEWPDEQGANGDSVTISEDGSRIVDHDENVFSLDCDCSHCLIHRQTIIQLYMEDVAHNELWARLKNIVQGYYTLIPEDESSHINKKYQEFANESNIRWCSDGKIDARRNIQISLGSNLSLSNEMTFIILFNMLYTRDPHQLFELLSLQIKSIALAYKSEILQHVTESESSAKQQYDPIVLMNLILDGYDQICEIAETLTPLVIELQRGHLENFNMTWLLVNQAMFYRWVYLDFETLMAECILELKECVDHEFYKSIVYRFIKFDEEMTLALKQWTISIAKMNQYLKSDEELDRMSRISVVHSIFTSMQQLDVPLSTEPIETLTIGEPSSILDWIISSNKQDVWLNMMQNIKSKWCASDLFDKHHKDDDSPCKCWICVMIGYKFHAKITGKLQVVAENDKTEWNFMKLIVNAKYEETEHACCSKEPVTTPELSVYHLAWALFKQLKDRQPYRESFVQPDKFCVFQDKPCQRIDCAVATNIIVGCYPLNFSKFLIKTYHPLNQEDRDMLVRIPNLEFKNLLKKFCDDISQISKEYLDANQIHPLLLMNMFWDPNDPETVPLGDLASALGENYRVNVKFPHKHIIFSYFITLFQTDGLDIQLDLDWLEQINSAKLFKNFSGINGIKTDDSKVNEIEAKLNELRINVVKDEEKVTGLHKSVNEITEKINSMNINNDMGTRSLIENEIKKPLVEALKLAASNKKLEAELRSLQKEHNMLKDMVKGLEQIHGEKKPEDPVAPKSPEKIADQAKKNGKCGHSAEGECVCYYCTLFGKNDCNASTNNRIAETRDRLRKRLHQLQNGKDISKSKNIKMKISTDLLAKGINSTKPCNNNNHESIDLRKPTVESKAFDFKPKIPITIPGSNTAKKSVEQPRNDQKDKLDEQAAKTVNNRDTPFSDLVKMYPKVERKPIKKGPSEKPNEKVSFPHENEINMRSIENLLDYIEGTPKVTPKAPPAPSVKQAQDDKAALKKARQKARQIEMEKILRLKEMNIELLGVTTESKQLANQLVQIRRGKRQDPVKVAQVESNVEETLTRKFRLELNIMDELKEIKAANAAFDVREGCALMKAVLDLVETKENLESQKQQILINSTAQPGMNPEDDPSRRMVTIRRINLPYSEPQVTVTAKGTSPEQDQLLYTFINGQMVAAPAKKSADLDQVILKSISKVLQPYMKKGEDVSKFVTISGPTKVMQVNGSAKPSDNPVAKVVKTAQNPVETKDLTPVKVMPVKVEKKPTKINEIPKSRSELKKELKAQMKQAKQAIEIKEQPKEIIKTRSALKKERKASKQVLEATKARALKEEKLAEKLEEKPKEIKRAFIDPEFDNNAFRLLDLDDDPSSSESELPIDSEVEEEVIVPPPPPLIVEDKLSNKNLKKNKVKLDLELAKMESKKDALAKQANSKKQKKYAEAVNKAAAVIEKKSEVKETKEQKKPKQLTKEQVKQKKIEDLSRSMAALQSNYKEKPSNASIMDQLSRGIRVEGLKLPPGITLTKVDSQRSENVRLAKESIGKIAQPFGNANYPQNQVPVDPNGIFMMESSPYASALISGDQKPKSKKNKKKKKKEGEEVTFAPPRSQSGSTQKEDMVTLKNPMFFNNYSGNDPTVTSGYSSSNGAMSTPPNLRPDQHAAIIKNENGMYTIRNPAFQGAFQNGGSGISTPSFSAPLPAPIGPPQSSQNLNRSYEGNNFSQSTPFASAESNTSCEAPSTPYSAIGSEMKDVLQRKAAMYPNGFNKHMDGMPFSVTGLGEQYSHFGGIGPQSQAGSYNNFGLSNTFTQQESSSFQNGHYQGQQHKYEDPIFLQNLIPGQKLNAEVTIHSISESKFLKKTSPVINDIGITPVNRRSDRENHQNFYAAETNAPTVKPPAGVIGSGAVSESVFIPNQKINLNELESEDRDIESFKRFDYYFQPPANKVKVNINVKDIVVNAKNRPGDEFADKKIGSTSSDSPSSLISTSMASCCSNGSSLDEYYENDAKEFNVISDEMKRQFNNCA